MADIAFRHKHVQLDQRKLKLARRDIDRVLRAAGGKVKLRRVF